MFKKSFINLKKKINIMQIKIIKKFKLAIILIKIKSMTWDWNNFYILNQNPIIINNKKLKIIKNHNF